MFHASKPQATAEGVAYAQHQHVCKLTPQTGETDVSSQRTTFRDQTDLDVSEVDAVQVGEHLVDLGRVLEDSAGCLGEMVQTGVATQCLGKCVG